MAFLSLKVKMILINLKSQKMHEESSRKIELCNQEGEIMNLGNDMQKLEGENGTNTKQIKLK